MKESVILVHFNYCKHRDLQIVYILMYAMYIGLIYVSFKNVWHKLFILITNCFRIEHDNSGIAPGWLLEKVILN